MRMKRLVPAAPLSLMRTSPLSLLYYRLNKTSDLSCSSYGFPSRPFTILVALPWRFYNSFMTFLYCGTKTCPQDFRWGTESSTWPLLNFIGLVIGQGLFSGPLCSQGSWQLPPIQCCQQTYLVFLCVQVINSHCPVNSKLFWIFPASWLCPIVI